MTIFTSVSFASTKEIHFGLISTESSQNLKSQWLPIIQDMEQELGLKVSPYFSSDYAGIIEAMRYGKVDIAWVGNKSAMEAVDRAGGEVFVQVISEDGYPGYHSVLIVPKDSPINSLDDIIQAPGKYSFGNGDPNSTSGFLIPSYYVFAKNNIDPKRHFKIVMNASHEANALAVASGQLDIATNNTTMVGDPDRELKKGRLWQTNPAMAEKIKVVWKSPLIPHEPLVYRKDLPQKIKDKISAFFVSYGKNQTEKSKLSALNSGVSGFKPSTNALLQPIREIESHRDVLMDKGK